MALPLLLGAREKARIAGCDKAYAVVAGELKVRVQRVRTGRRSVGRVSRWQGDIGVSLGLTHNLGGFPFQNICSISIIGRYGD